MNQIAQWAPITTAGASYTNIVYLKLTAEWISYLIYWSYMNGFTLLYIDGLMQERHNSTANELELRLSCINPSIWNLWSMDDLIGCDIS